MVFPQTMRFLSLIMIILIGCAQSNLDRLPQIRYGKDHCSECRMIINEEVFASVLVKTSGEVVKFDDLGCLVRFRNRMKLEEIKKIWVHDYESGNWIETKSATFVYAKDLITPMGYSLAAFENNLSAKKLAEEKSGEIINFDQYQIN